MGWFNRRKKAEKQRLEDESFEWMTVGEAITKERMQSGSITFAEIMQRCEECCEQYSDAISRRESIYKEMENLESYINDVARLDELSDAERALISDMTKNLVQLVEEREHYQERQNERISPAQYLKMERYEEEVPASLATLKEQEQLRKASLNDLHTLEREKDRLDDHLEQLKGKKVFFKNMAIAMVVVMFLMFAVLGVLGLKTGVDLSMVIMITAMLSIVFIAVLVLANQNNTKDTKLTVKKINRAIKLTNSTKIKFVNSTNAVDFACEKYDVDGYDALAALWENYCITKAEREKYQKNTGRIEELSDALSVALSGLGIKDPEVFVCQPECILDRRERVEVRHHLLERRRVIKDRLDFAVARCDSTRSELLWMMENFPERKEEFVNLSRSYGLYEFAPTAGH